jgi:hypothetical protein
MEEPNVKFDPTVNLGHIISAIVMIISMIATYFALKSDIRDHESRLTVVEEAYKSQHITNNSTRDALNKIETGVAVIRDRMERVPAKP